MRRPPRFRIARVLAPAMLLMMLLVSRGEASPEEAHAARVVRVLEGHIVPGFAALKVAAEKLPLQVSRHCLGDKTADVAEAFQATASAFAAVDFYRFGPLAEKGRRERLSFWPDPRGSVARQVRQAVGAKEVQWLAEGALMQQSAAVQGLPALEMLLLDQGLRSNETAAKYACDLAIAVAQNIALLSREVLEAWVAPGGTREKLLTAGAGNDLYKSHSEAAGELLKALLTGLQAVAEQQLKPRLEGAKTSVKGPYARYGLQRQIYAASTQSLRRLYDELDLEASLAPEKVWIKNWASGTWRAIAMSDGIGGAAQGVDGAAAPPLREVVSRIGGLRLLIGKEMSHAAGLAIGFNELDGD